MDDTTAAGTKEALQRMFPDDDVIDVWYCPGCEVFSKEVNEISDADGDCTNCGECQVIRAVMVA